MGTRDVAPGHADAPDGEGAPARAVGRALDYLDAASRMGTWGGLTRRGFDALVRDGAPERALLLYAEVGRGEW